MNILRFPATTRPGDRLGDPVEESQVAAAPSPTDMPPPASADARLLRSLSILNRPIIEGVMSRRPRAQDVLSAFRAEWTPPRLRAPRPANDAPRP